MSTQPYLDCPLPGGGWYRHECDEETVAWVKQNLGRIPRMRDALYVWPILYGGGSYDRDQTGEFLPDNDHRILARDLECALRDALNQEGYTTEIAYHRTTGSGGAVMARLYSGNDLVIQIQRPCALFGLLEIAKHVGRGPYATEGTD